MGFCIQTAVQSPILAKQGDHETLGTWVLHAADSAISLSNCSKAKEGAEKLRTAIGRVVCAVGQWSNRVLNVKLS